MFWSFAVDNQVYVFYNGELIYKKWTNTNQPSKVFDPGGLPPFDLPS